MVNVDVVAPMPRAATAIAVMLKPGARPSERNAYLTSCRRISKCTAHALVAMSTRAPASNPSLAAVDRSRHWWLKSFSISAPYSARKDFGYRCSSAR
jgi:hypothetical protein